MEKTQTPRRAPRRRRNGLVILRRSLLVFSSYWAIDFTNRRNPGLQVKEIVVEEG